MEVTEVRITPREEGRLLAFANITFDDCFVVRGLKIIDGNDGLFVSMPSRRKPDGSYQDVAHPIENTIRIEIEKAVMAAYENACKQEEFAE